MVQISRRLCFLVHMLVGIIKHFLKADLKLMRLRILEDFKKAVLENDSMSTEKILNLIK